MQTFLPYPDFVKSAQCLDRLRLGKQRVECLQILRALTGISSGWINHPATKMWAGYENSLRKYALAICFEWTNRGYKDNCAVQIEAMEIEETGNPKWLGDNAFHASHRSNLLRKDVVHYGQFGWTEPNDLPYVWPV